MAKDGKFGTFGGVFTPSILTILGVIMYLRLPWVVGQAGLYQTLVIVAVAHTISICTGLSIASIATDKNVGAGGPYYIISRSLGLPIGGTIGLSLFVGLAFSISLYIIGFSESLLSTIGLDPTDKNHLRICGTIWLVVVTGVTIVSTELAIKTQYVILALIGLSLVSIFLGQGASPPEPHLHGIEKAASWGEIFGIFFPAVTGFTAGVNMSGDLRDPKKAIPGGTMAAVGVGFVVYVGLSIFIAYRVPVEGENGLLGTETLQTLAFFSPTVLLGIWGATLSSALGSVMGAPRILQAVASDGIAPRWLARGYGKSAEPRNALFVAFLLAEAGILIAELNTIARIVSMVFLTMYGFLNLASVLESWASPDFRPSFRIPKAVSIIGAIFTAVVMVVLDPIAWAGATLFMIVLYLLLTRQRLRLESGDTWEGIWSSLLRSALFRLQRHLGKEGRQQRNWRPNLLVFQPPGGFAGTRERTRGLATSLIGNAGLLSEFELVSPQGRKGAGPGSLAVPDEPRPGVSHTVVPAREPHAVVAAMSRYHGFSVIRPNTVLLPWRGFSEDTDKAEALLADLTNEDLNVLVYWDGKDADEASSAEATQGDRKAGARDRGRRTIDVWWRAGEGNLALTVALLRFITRDDRFRQAQLRVLLYAESTHGGDSLRATARRFFRNNRVEADIQVVANPLDARTYAERVAEESASADLTMLGLPEEPGDVHDLISNLGPALLLRGSSAFEDVLVLGREAAISAMPPPTSEGGRASLPEVPLPDTPDLARLVADFVDDHQAAVGAFHEEVVSRATAARVKLLRKVTAVVDKHFEQLEKGIQGANARRQLHAVNRAQSSLAKNARELVAEWREVEVEAQRTLLETRVETILGQVDELEGRRRGRVTVERRLKDFEARPGDGRYLRRFKRGHRWRGWFLGRKRVRYRVPTGALRSYHEERIVAQVLRPALRGIATDGHRVAVELGKLLAETVGGMTLLGGDPEEGQLAELVVKQKEQALGRLGDLVRHLKEGASTQQWASLVELRSIATGFAEDLDRLDVVPLARKERRPGAGLGDAATFLGELAEQWTTRQRQLLERAELALSIAGFQHRLWVAAHKARGATEVEFRGGALSDCEALRAALADLADRLEAGEALPEKVDLATELKSRFDGQGPLGTLVRDAEEATRDLPEAKKTPSDESIQRLAEGDVEQPTEVVDLPVRRLIQFMVESELLGGLEDEFDRIPKLEQRAVSVAQDVVRLVSFHAGELELLGAEQLAEVREQLLPVLRNGIERLDGELNKLRAAAPELGAAVDRRVHQVLQKTKPYELGSAAASLDQGIRFQQGLRAVSGVRYQVQRFVDWTRGAMVELLYRRSASVVRARELASGVAETAGVVDRILSRVMGASPRADVLEGLPFYYRQLFVGQSAIGDSFWVGRQRELERARQAATAFRGGTPGAILVVGDRFSGKSALLQRFGGQVLAGFNVVRVPHKGGGSADLAHFREALGAAVGTGGDFEQLMSALPERPAIVIDDLDLWWERGPGGLAVVDKILDLIQRHGHRVLFVVTAGSPAFSVLSRLRPIGDVTLAIIECGPLHAEQLKEVVMLRHASTGLSFELNGHHEDQLGTLSVARLFSRYFDHTEGNVGLALRSWISHVDKVRGEVLAVRTPELASWDDLDDLRPEQVAVLLQLAIHKRAGADRLRRLSRLPRAELQPVVDTLQRMGLVVEGSQRALEINPYAQAPVLALLRRQGVLA